MGSGVLQARQSSSGTVFMSTYIWHDSGVTPAPDTTAPGNPPWSPMVPKPGGNGKQCDGTCGDGGVVNIVDFAGGGSSECATCGGSGGIIKSYNGGSECTTCGSDLEVREVRRRVQRGEASS